MNSYIELKKHYRYNELKREEAERLMHQSNSDKVSSSGKTTSHDALFYLSLFFVAAFFSMVLFGIQTDCPNTANYVYCAISD